MTEKEARQAVKDFRAQYPELEPQFRLPKGYRHSSAVTGAKEQEPSGKSSSIDSRSISLGAAAALAAFLAIVWIEFGLLVSAGTFSVIFVALLVWAAREFKAMMKDENFE